MAGTAIQNALLELLRVHAEVAPDARPRSAGPRRYALRPRRWLVSAGAIVVSACLVVGGLAVAGLVGQGTAASWELVSTLNPLGNSSLAPSAWS